MIESIRLHNGPVQTFWIKLDSYKYEIPAHRASDGIVYVDLLNKVPLKLQRKIGEIIQTEVNKHYEINNIGGR